MKPASVIVRPWQSEDFARLAAAAPRLSLWTLFRRFRAGMPGLPATYLASIRRRWPGSWVRW